MAKHIISTNIRVNTLIDTHLHDAVDFHQNISEGIGSVLDELGQRNSQSGYATSDEGGMQAEVFVGMDSEPATRPLDLSPEASAKRFNEWHGFINREKDEAA